MCKQKNNTMFLTKIIVYVQVDRKKKKKKQLGDKEERDKKDLGMDKDHVQVHMGISVSLGAQPQIISPPVFSLFWEKTF